MIYLFFLLLLNNFHKYAYKVPGHTISSYDRNCNVLEQCINTNRAISGCASVQSPSDQSDLRLPQRSAVINGRSKSKVYLHDGYNW